MIASDINFHGVTALRASTPGSIGAPVIISLTGSDYSRASVTIFVGDAELARRLVDAINTAVLALNAPRWPETPPTPCPQETAAYAARDYLYQGDR